MQVVQPFARRVAPRVADQGVSGFFTGVSEGQKTNISKFLQDPLIVLGHLILNSLDWFSRHLSKCMPVPDTQRRESDEARLVDISLSDLARTLIFELFDDSLMVVLITAPTYQFEPNSKMQPLLVDLRQLLVAENGCRLQLK